jgi:anti-anti-sigma regulatory factor/HAMP domain-containing protein
VHVILGLVAVLALGTMALVSYRLGVSTLERQAIDQLTSIRELKGRQVELYFEMIRDQVVSLSENRMVVDALREFSAATEELGGVPPLGADADLALSLYYQDEFLPRLSANVDDAGPATAYLPQDQSARYLQHLFISGNPFEVGSKQLLDESDSGTGYDAVHRLYHPIFRSFLERFGFYDLFLVSATDDRIVYTVFKEVDFGTSLAAGPHRDSNLAEAYRAARRAELDSFSHLIDFAPYAPSYGAPASFIASPVMDGDEVLGVLVFQLPLDRINETMTNGGGWRSVGMGESGEAYLVGPDERLRTESRFLIEDLEGYLQAIREAGVGEDVVRAVAAQGSAVGLQPVSTEGVRRALDRESGVARFLDYRGVEVFSSFRPLSIPGLDWVLMSEIDVQEALAPVATLSRRMLIALAGLLPLLGLLGYWFAANLVRPIHALADTSARLADGQLEAEVDVTRGDEIGDLARSFETMRVSLRDLIDRQNRSIEALSTPLIPIHDDVIVLPLVGELDKLRCDQIRGNLTTALHENGARYAILDLTGVPILDGHVTRELLAIAQSARLLGAGVIISGIQPALAAEMAEQGVELDGVLTARTLRDAIKITETHDA